MGRVIEFEERAVATLRSRLGAVESARDDLAAFARGHSGAVATIYRAVIAALEADSFEAMTAIVTREWPALLGIDTVALALVVGTQGFRIDAAGVEHLEPALIDRACWATGDAALASVARGHALFGRDAQNIRAEALIHLDGDAPFPRGLLLLGQTSDAAGDSDEGAQLLQFLGAALAAMLRRWTMAA